MAAPRDPVAFEACRLITVGADVHGEHGLVRILIMLGLLRRSEVRNDADGSLRK
jgi:hypothetical protein